MTLVETSLATDDTPNHAAALAELTTQADRIRYAAMHAPDSRTQTVRDWLRRYGIETRRSYASHVLSAWRRRHGLPDTGEQPKMTPELLAELDASSATSGFLGADAELRTSVDPGLASTPEDSVPTESRTPVDAEPSPAPTPVVSAGSASTELRTSVDAEPAPLPSRPRKPVPVWPIVIMCLGAFVAVWSGWVGLGELTGFGEINLLPGIAPTGGWATINSSITLPLGVEAYAAYALWVWLSGRVRTVRARRFAMWSALAALAVGCLGQAAYHLLVANPDLLSVASDGTTHAPMWVVVLVSSLPVLVLGMGAALAHMVRSDD